MGGRAALVLHRGDPEDQDPGDAEGLGLLGDEPDAFRRPAVMAGQRGDRLFLGEAVGDEEREHEPVGREAGLGDQPPQSRGRPEPAKPAGVRGHTSIVSAIVATSPGIVWVPASAFTSRPAR